MDAAVDAGDTALAEALRREHAVLDGALKSGPSLKDAPVAETESELAARQLCVACFSGDLEAAFQLLKGGSNVNAKSKVSCLVIYGP